MPLTASVTDDEGFLGFFILRSSHSRLEPLYIKYTSKIGPSMLLSGPHQSYRQLQEGDRAKWGYFLWIPACG